MRGNQVLGAGSIALGSGLAANSILGPMAAEVIRYRFSEVLVSQTIGLDAAALAAVAPLAVVGGVLCWRNHAAGPPLVLGPAAFALHVALATVFASLLAWLFRPLFRHTPSGGNEQATAFDSRMGAFLR